MLIKLLFLIKHKYIILSIVFKLIILDVGLISASLIASSSLPFKIAVGGFIGGILIFVVPLYYISTQGGSPILSKTMPIGGLCMLSGWTSLLFA